MASATTPVVPPQAPSQAASTNVTPRGGYRGRSRGGRNSRSVGEARDSPRRPQGERGGGRRKVQGGRNQQQNRPQDSATSVEKTILTKETVLGGPSGPKTPTEVKPDADDAASDSESPVCFICADPVKYSAIAPCSHVTCHICALRMRALYKNKACAHCRTEAEWVIFSKDETKRFLEFKESDIVSRNDALGIKYDDQLICDDTTFLLHFNCPEESCDQALRSWPDLHHHVKSVHHRFLCDLCSRNKKVFTHEHTLFTPAELRKHERTGDDQPGSENQSGFKGHPECGFCHQRFYSSDELFTHCRDKHERCHICDRRNPTAQQQYYIDYNALAAHFAKDHFMCADDECMEKKFVVFENEVDLKAHQLEVHPNGLSKNARRDARRIDIRAFAADTHDHGGGRRRRNDGRGQQEREEAPIRTEQQMSRAELAYHRTLAVQSAQSTTSRTFGGQLTEPVFQPRPPPQAAPRPLQSMTTAAQPPVRPPARPAELPSAVTAVVARVAFPPLAPARPAPETAPAPPPVAFPPLAPARLAPETAPPPPPVTFPPLGPTRPTPEATPAQVAFPPLAPSRPAPKTAVRPSAANTPTDNGRKLRHTAVIERARTLLCHDENKMSIFKSDISRFRQGVFTATNLVEHFWALFEVKTSELGVLIRELAELFEDDAQRRELLRAWNDWKVTNEDYPPFAGVSSPSAAGSNSSRALKLKSSTSHSARSTTARQRGWGAAASVPPSSSSTPSATPTARSVNRQGPGAHAPTPWVAPGATATSGKARGTDEFPSLPVKPPPPPGWGPIKNKDPYAAYNGAPVPQARVWGVGGNGGERSEEPSESEGYGGGSKQGKKKGKGKQMLFRVGLEREN